MHVLPALVLVPPLFLDFIVVPVHGLFVSARITVSRVYILAITSATHLLFILLFDNVNALARSGDRIDRRAACRAKMSCLCHIESCLNAAFEAVAVILIARPQFQLEFRASM